MQRDDDIQAGNGFTFSELQRRYEHALSRLTVAQDDLEWEWWVHVVEACLEDMRACIADYAEAARRLDETIDSTFGSAG